MNRYVPLPLLAIGPPPRPDSAEVPGVGGGPGAAARAVSHDTGYTGFSACVR